MTKTTNYQLNQWAKSDRVLMEDFNTDNAKIDAALAAKAEITFGQYTGTGGHGERLYTQGGIRQPKKHRLQLHRIQVIGCGHKKGKASKGAFPFCPAAITSICIRCMVSFRHGAVSFLKNRGNARPEGRAFQPVEKSYQEGAFLFCLPQLQPFSDYASTEKV